MVNFISNNSFLLKNGTGNLMFKIDAFHASCSAYQAIP
jgi:hypothetical protein